MGVLRVYKKALKTLNPHIYSHVRVSTTIYGVFRSGREDLNLRPLAPHSKVRALTLLIVSFMPI